MPFWDGEDGAHVGTQVRRTDLHNPACTAHWRLVAPDPWRFVSGRDLNPHALCGH